MATATNPPIHIASSYLPPYDTPENDLKTIQTFLDTIKPKNLVWGMDANSKHRLWHSPRTDTRGRILADFLSLHGLIIINEKDGPTYSGPTGESWIDITAATIDVAHKIINWRVSEETTLSDHNLILFSLKTRSYNMHLNRRTGHLTRKYATQVGNWNLFQQRVLQHSHQWEDHINNARTKFQLDTAISTIWEDLGNICCTCFPPFLPKTKYVPWWSPKLNSLRKHVNALKRRLKRCKNPALRDMYNSRYKDLKNKYKAEILKAKQDSWKEFCMEHVKSSPWKVYKMCKAGFARNPVPTTLTLPDGTSTTSAKETADALLLKFFPNETTTSDSAQHRTIRAHVAGTNPPDTQAVPNFKPHEVDEVIGKLQDKKCPGPDGIDGPIVKRIHRILPSFWTTLMNKCLILGCFPQVWKTARVIAIPKTDKRKLNTVQGYRGISLLPIPGKCLESLVVGRLNFFLESTGQIPQQQYGFTAGRSTVDAIHKVIESVHRGRKLGTKCCLLTLDISGAFDNAWHPAVLARLWEKKCPSNIYTIIKDFLLDRNAHIRLGDTVSSKRVTKGCPQGSVSGPTLWNIIISGLIESLSKASNLEIVTFADDILLMFHGPSHLAVLTTVENLSTIEEWCKIHKLEISKDKTALMPMYIRKSDLYKSHPGVTTRGITVVSKMKYLGVMLDSKLDWFPHTLYLENKILHIRNNLARCSKATWGISYSNLTIVYKHALLPIITHAAEAWHSCISKKAKNKLQQIQRSLLIFLTKAYRSVSLDALQAIAGLMPIELAVSLYKDTRAISRGQQTNAVITQLKNIETPVKIKGTNPIDNYVQVVLTGVEGIAEVSIYTDGSKTEQHVGAGMVAMKDSREIHTDTQRLNNDCTVFQAELCGIRMAIEWIQNQRKKAPTYAINVDSKAAILAIANKHSTHPLAVDTRRKTIELRKDTSVTLHWVKGHSGLKGN